MELWSHGAVELWGCGAAESYPSAQQRGGALAWEQAPCPRAPPFLPPSSLPPSLPPPRPPPPPVPGRNTASLGVELSPSEKETGTYCI